MLFALLTWQVATEGTVVRVDVAVRDAATHASTTSLVGSRTPQLLADLGGALAALLVLAASAGWHGSRGRGWAPEGRAAAATLAVPVLVLPLKAALARTGPDGAALGDYAGYYPSGHAATAAVAYGGLALLRARPAGYALAVLLNLGVGAGLVLRDYHWASDVLASWLLAGLLLCGLAALRARSRRPGGRSFSRTRGSVRRPRAAPTPTPADSSGCRHRPAAPTSEPPL
ncbi:phosphatase PAP2 family protein [Streptomyces oceani]|uniref:phosphatase PAP2 family protein n=1 Tax=Streptomyces oceani TaxID=1075402 RepID=UPI001FCD5DBA|nr:phosphatase PAP2 family protein [Streptomyces oceani]